jgi:drug/metabolite transporter (DMT)-like permease
VKGRFMHSSAAPSTPAVGAAWALFAVFCFSVNDMLVKWVSGDYALHQVVLIRSVVGLAFVLAFIVPFSGGLGALRTRRLGLHVLRGLCVVAANMFFFLGIAAIPLAEAVAIFFVSPLIIAVFSVIFLHERVGPGRWAAIAIGLIGVAVVIRPGTAAFQVAALLPMLAAVGYAGLHMLTRYIRDTEGASAMVFWVQATFIVVSGAIGLALGDGRFEGAGHPSLEFLVRAWVWPLWPDLIVMIALGVVSSLGGYAISQAYRLSEAALVAPFEYAAMPLAVMWGIVFFNEWPDGVALAGIFLILLSGLVFVWREARAGRRRAPAPLGVRESR